MSNTPANQDNRFKKPVDIAQMNGSAPAIVTGFSFVTGKYAKQLKLDFITARGTHLSGWFTLDSAKQINMLIAAGVISEDDDGFCQVVGLDEQKQVTIEVEAGKIKSVKKISSSNPAL
jgi:hypothetical protein